MVYRVRYTLTMNMNVRTIRISPRTSPNGRHDNFGRYIEDYSRKNWVHTIVMAFPEESMHERFLKICKRLSYVKDVKYRELKNS